MDSMFSANPRRVAPRHDRGHDGHHDGSDAFRRMAARVAHAAGRPSTFGLAVVAVVAWAAAGPFFGFSDTWQLVINTSTTIITFLMVFIIQNTQNRDSHALHLKLDELIRASRSARNRLLDAEQFPVGDIDRNPRIRG